MILLDALLLLLVGPGLELESPVTVTMTSLLVSTLMEFRASMDRCLTSLLAASIVAPVTPVRGLLVTSDSAGDNGRVESGERRAGVTLSPEWSDRAGAGVRRERGEM